MFETLKKRRLLYRFSKAAQDLLGRLGAASACAKSNHYAGRNRCYGLDLKSSLMGIEIVRIFSCLFFVAFSVFAAQTASAEKRVALVIGNSAYREATRLTNPSNDALAVGILFQDIGFNVVQTRTDLGIDEMRRALRDFTETAQSADIAVVFFAGHGIEVDGTNYLIPVDAVLRRDVDVEDEAVSLDRVLRILEPVKKLRIVILDACRDNPFLKSMKRTLSSRSLGRGLAGVDPPTSDTLIAFAAKAGSTASDGVASHSPFTSALIQHIAEPGIDIRIAFGRIHDDVLKATSNSQEPFLYGSLGGAMVSLVTYNSVQIGAFESLSNEIRKDYELAARVETKEGWAAFLSRYPSGFYADLARAMRVKLDDAKSSEKAHVEPTTSGALKEEPRQKQPRKAEQHESPESIARRQCTHAWQIHRGDPTFEAVLRRTGCGKYE
jgi:hypothetical protein